MKLMVIGGGGREHAIIKKLKENPAVEEIYCLPGNGGIAADAVCVPEIGAKDIPAQVEFAKVHRIDYAVVAPDDPLALGAVDALTEAGIPCFGPDKKAAVIEASKAFSKDLMKKYGIPTAKYELFTDADAACAYIDSQGAPIVVKADGLAAGKGVVVAQTKEEALEALDQIMGGVFGSAGSRVVIEEFLVGEEVSLLAFCDGKTALPLPSAQDHKAVFDGDTGPNTGGMGAYSPAPIVPDAELEKMADIAIRPILAEMARQGHPFTGILYAGLMMTKDGPKVLEYNVRFGDPECEPLLMRLESDLLEIMDACIDGRLDEVKLSIRPESALGVVIAAEGYPGSYPKGMEIKGIDAVDALPDTKVFQAGTKREGSRTLSSGGRVLCVTALGKGLAEAQKRAYEAVAKIDMEKSQHRSDIGAKGLRRL